MLSTVLILPDVLRDEGNRMGAAMGWGPDNFSVPLSADGGPPPTHWGLHAWAADTFPDLLASAVVPPELAEAGFTQAEWDAIRAGMIQSYWTDYTDHFNTVIAENSLAVVNVEQTV